MKNKLAILTGVVAATGMLATQRAEALTLGFANLSHSVIQFNGNSTFDFAVLSGSGNQFVITSSDGVGDAVPLEGNVTGTFTMGAIVGDVANVTGSGNLVIKSGSGNLTANVAWDQISYDSSGTLNVTGMINLTGINYPGTVNDLQALAAAGIAEDKVTFTFTSAETLAALETTQTATTYAGVITTVPDGGFTLVLLGIGLSALGLRARRVA